MCVYVCVLHHVMYRVCVCVGRIVCSSISERSFLFFLVKENQSFGKEMGECSELYSSYLTYLFFITLF